jgi:hypothetical protein
MRKTRQCVLERTRFSYGKQIVVEPADRLSVTTRRMAAPPAARVNGLLKLPPFLQRTLSPSSSSSTDFANVLFSALSKAH